MDLDTISARRTLFDTRIISRGIGKAKTLGHHTSQNRPVGSVLKGVYHFLERSLARALAAAASRFSSLGAQIY